MKNNKKILQNLKCLFFFVFKKFRKHMFNFFLTWTKILEIKKNLFYKRTLARIDST